MLSHRFRMLEKVQIFRDGEIYGAGALSLTNRILYHIPSSVISLDTRVLDCMR